MENSFNELLEQDLFKAIIAIGILIILFIIFIVLRVISVNRKKKAVMLKRKQHMADMEKSVAKRIEQTQTISRSEIGDLKNDFSNDSSLEKTQELNLDAIRKKALLEVKNQSTQELSKESLLSDDDNSKAVLKKQRLEQQLENTKELSLSDVRSELKDNEQKESNVLVEELKVEEESVYNNSSYQSDYNVKPSGIKTPEFTEFDSFNEANEVLDDAFEDDESLDDINLLENSSPTDEISSLMSTTHTFMPTQEEFDYNVLRKANEEDFSIVKSFDTIITEENVVTPNNEIEEFSTLELKEQLQSYDDEVLSTQLNIIEEEDEAVFESTLTRLTQDDLDEMPLTTDTTQVNDYDYVNKFDFGYSYFSDVQGFSDINNNKFKFGNTDCYEKNGVFEDSLNVFSFGVNNNKESSPKSVSPKSTFEFGVNKNYEADVENEIVPTNFTFNNAYYYVDLDDLIDVALVNTNVKTKDEVFLQKVDEAVVGDMLEEVIEASDVDENATQVKEQFVDEQIDDRVYENYVNENETQVMEVEDDNVVIDVTSQLDLLDTYEEPEIDDFDFADENYNYNFNNISIMDEIVNDVLFDESPVAVDDEYLQYVYQFALLEDAIDDKSKEVVDDYKVEKPIVNEVSLHIDKVISNNAKQPSKKYDFLDELFNESKKQEDELVKKVDGKIDEELMNLSNMVLNNDDVNDLGNVDNDVADKAYNKSTPTKVFSPIFGISNAPTKVKTGEDFDNDNLTDELEDDLRMQSNLVDLLANDSNSNDVNEFMDEMLEKSENSEEVNKDFLAKLKEMTK